MWLEKGWEEFMQDNEIRLGDVVVFDHMGNMVFDVMLFDPSACEKHCSSSTKNVTTATNKMMTVKKGDPLRKLKLTRPPLLILSNKLLVPILTGVCVFHSNLQNLMAYVTMEGRPSSGTARETIQAMFISG
ncbi:hypothetical protein Syun_005241 [Stephania yunnanensis]|uniref:TF-B3 domain-containing protein n=1 Tax=Stephania yunnanensis TaxID=152371 RepID=A0AAP0L8J5_9MAGN